jgi:hypothetical protein
MFTEPELLEWLAREALRLTGSGRSGLYMFFEARLESGSTELGDEKP